MIKEVTKLHHAACHSTSETEQGKCVYCGAEAVKKIYFSKGINSGMLQSFALSAGVFIFFDRCKSLH
jgi:hypothetical protein